MIESGRRGRNPPAEFVKLCAGAVKRPLREAQQAANMSMDAYHERMRTAATERRSRRTRQLMDKRPTFEAFVDTDPLLSDAHRKALKAVYRAALAS